MMQERAKTQVDQKERLSPIVARLEDEAKDRVSKRSTIEARWLEDLRQYHGQYSDTELKKFERDRQSKLFINLTGAKTDAMSARLQDLLFPSDDKNWGIKPTPVPDMAEQASDAKAKIGELEAAVADMQARAQAGDQQAAAQLPELQGRMEQLTSADAKLRREMEEASKRSERMSSVIDDQLKECQYHAVMRDVNDDGCKLGTGVCKGPVRIDKARRRWVMTEGQFQLADMDEDSVGFQRVNPWGFFPSMDVTDVQDSDGVFERHLMTAKKLRKLQYSNDYDKDALRAVLKQEPRTGDLPDYLSDLQALTGEGGNGNTGFYVVWEYSGPLTAEEMRELALYSDDAETAREMEEDIDPLKEVQARVWFCQGEILKFAIYPYDSGECMYSVFNLKKDESSLFGYGIPYMMRHPQDMLNAAARQMMNNAGVAAGPQIVLDRSQLETPEDGDWSVRPFKIWIAKDGIAKDEDYMRIYNIDSHQAELAAIMAIAQKHIDDETGLSALAQGDQGSGVTKTFQGMALLINASNIVFRRIVKNFDDDVTVPNIRRLYDWNMQFSKREDIKGDYEVDARGSSVLLAREIQAQNLHAFALQFGAHPVYGPMIKHADLLRKTVQTLQMPTDDVVKDDDTISSDKKQAEERAKEAAQMQAQSQGMSPEQMQLEQAKLQMDQMRLQADMARANLEADYKLKVAMANRETQMMQLATNANVKMEEVAAKLQDSREKRDFELDMINIEQLMTLTTGQTAGGRV